MVPILEVRNVTKRFPGVLANDRVSFSLNKGEILAFLGENGAGKSTLMNILYGLYTQDEGEIEVRERHVEINDPNDAIELGIGMVHQHFQLVPVFTVAENIVMGTEPVRFSFCWKTMGIASGASALLFFVGGLLTLDNPLQSLLAGLAGGAALAILYGLFVLLGLLSRLGARIYLPVVGAVSVAFLVLLTLWLEAADRIPLVVFLGLLFALASYPVLTVMTTALDRRTATGRIRELSDQYGLVVDPDALVEDIPVGVQQRVEIIKTLYREAEIIILDEPTKGIDIGSKAAVHEFMAELAAQGLAVIMVSSEIPEVLGMSDRIIVMREGRIVAEVAGDDMNPETLVRHAAGITADSTGA